MKAVLGNYEEPQATGPTKRFLFTRTGIANRMTINTPGLVGEMKIK